MTCRLFVTGPRDRDFWEGGVAPDGWTYFYDYLIAYLDKF
jgi:hypothetical protein